MRSAPLLAYLSCLALAFVPTLLRAADLVTASPPADATKFHIFLLMGQSNMAGSALPILPEDREPSTTVLAQAPDLSWHQAQTPLDAARGGGSSPGQSFARYYAALHPGVTVGLIQLGRGARALKELAKGGTDRDGTPNYAVALPRITAAMKQGTLKGVLWHQGESDSGDAKYVDRLAVVAADLRVDTGLPELPFIAGELGRYLGWGNNFNKGLPRLTQLVPHSAVASSEGLRELGDRVHFSGFSAEVLGARYLQEYLTLAEPTLVAQFAPQLATITSTMEAQDAAWDVLLNGDMTVGKTRPFAWDSLWLGKGSFDIASDRSEPASGAPSLRIASHGGPAQGSLAQTMRKVAGCTIKVSLKARNSGLGNLRINLYGNDGSWKQVYQQNLIDATAAKEWTAFSAGATVPANAANTRIAIVADGNGTAWIDDVVVERLTK